MHDLEELDDNEIASSSSDDEPMTTSSSDSSNSSMECILKRRRILHRSNNFIETIIDQYDSEEFKEHFRMRRETCNVLIGTLEVDKVLPTHSHGREKIDAKKGLLMTLWYLSNQETFRQLSDRFNVTKSSSHRIIAKIAMYFVQTSNKYIHWPNTHTEKVIIQGFKSLKGIGGVVGVIDGCHISINKPFKDSEVYCNRKSQFSILLQAVCDHKKKFTDILCGEAGSMHDARLLKKSSLYEKCMNGFLNENFLLGDSAYPCMEWLIPPFKDNGYLSKSQRIFNYRHSSTRIVVENALGLLKGRFRRLKHFDNHDIKLIVNCVITAVVFHNICLDLDDVSYESDIIEMNEEDCSKEVCGINANESKRNKIFNIMFNL